MVWDWWAGGGVERFGMGVGPEPRQLHCSANSTGGLHGPIVRMQGQSRAAALHCMYEREPLATGTGLGWLLDLVVRAP